MTPIGQNIVVQEVDLPEEKKIMTPNGKHPWALKVHKVGSGVIDENITEGALVAARGECKEFIPGYFLINASQVVAVVSEDEL